MRDEFQYLDILAIFHLIVGAMAGLFSCLPLINLSMGLPMLADIPKMLVQEVFSPFALLPIAFVFLPILLVVIGWMFAIAIALNGYYIKKRSWLTYCVTMSGIETIFIPFGTVLGVITIILLSKPNVKKSFDPV